jgi:hypothetical protein
VGDGHDRVGSRLTKLLGDGLLTVFGAGAYDFTSTQYSESSRHHVVTCLGSLVPAAKRPATKPDGEAIPSSANAWRPYSPNFRNPAGL